MGLQRQALVLLSGMLGDASLWDEVVPRVDDLAAPITLPTDTRDTVSGIAGEVLRQSPDRFALAGHSLGGIIAMEMARQAPARVAKLAILNTSARAGSPAQLDQWTRLAAQVQAGGFDAVAERMASNTLPARHRSEDLVARSATMAQTVGRDGFLRQLTAQLTRPDLRPSLGAVTAPTLVLSGALDHVSPPEMQTEIAHGIPTATQAVIPDSGHMSPLETPESVADQLRRWLLIK